MEMDTSEDSSTSDTRKAAVDPDVPVIPDAGMEEDTPEDSSTGDKRQDVVAPDASVSPSAVMDVDAPEDASTGDSRNVEAPDVPVTPGVSVCIPVTVPSTPRVPYTREYIMFQDKLKTSLAPIMMNFLRLLERVNATPDWRQRERAHWITEADIKELMERQAELSSQSHSLRLYQSAKLKDGESVPLIEIITEVWPTTKDPLHNFMNLMERIKADFDQRDRTRASLVTDAEFKGLVDIQSQLSSLEQIWSIYLYTTKLKDYESSESSTKEDATREPSPEPKAGPSWRETGESTNVTQDGFKSFMDAIERTKANERQSREGFQRGTGCDLEELRDFYGGNSSNIYGRLYPSAEMQDGESVSLLDVSFLDAKFEKWRAFWEAHRPDQAVIPRPTTPTVQVRSPISDLKFWDEDAQLEPPTGSLAEASLHEVSAMDTSKQSSSVSEDTLKQSPPTAVVEGYLKEIKAMDIPQLSPLSSSMDDVSKNKSSAMGTSKLSPPPSVDVSQSTTSSLLASKRLLEKVMLEENKVEVGKAADKGITLVPMAQIKAERAAGKGRSLVAIPGDEAKVKAEAQQALARFLAQVALCSQESALRMAALSSQQSALRMAAQSPQRSPLRVPVDTSSQSSSAASNDASKQSQSRSSSAASNDASRQSQSRSSSAASGVSRKRLLERDEEDQEGPNFFMTVPESDSEIKSEALKVLAQVLHQVDDDSSQSSAAAALDEKSLEEVTAMDTSKQSPVATMDDVSKGTSSTLDEDIYLHPDSLAVMEKDTRSRQSAEDIDTEKALSLYEIMIQNEAAAEQILAQVLSQVARDSPQPGPSGLTREQLMAAQREPNCPPTAEYFRRKTIKVLGTRMYFCSLPERDEVKWLMKAATFTLGILKAGNAPFNFLIDPFGEIISNQWFLFEWLIAPDTERATWSPHLERLSKVNYTKMVELEKLIRSYEGVNHYCSGMLEYIRATVHQLDVFNHPVYKTRGLTSISNKRKAARIWNHMKISLKTKKIKRIRKETNVASEYMNKFEPARLENNFYDKFYPTYNFLRNLMQGFRRTYMPEGVLFAMDELPVLRDEWNPFNRELAVILSTDMLQNYLMEDLANQSVLMDRSSMCEYVESYIAREYRAEDNFNKLYRQLMARNPYREQEDTEEDSEEVQALKNVLFRDCKNFVDQLIKIEPFNFLIQAIILILAKTMDLLLCLDIFTEKFIATEQLSRQRIRDRPEQVDYNKRFDQYVAEIKNVVAGLQEFVYRKVISIQVKLKSIKNVNYGGAYNAFVDLCRLSIHKLDCINTDRRMYESMEYNTLTDKTSDDLWAVKSIQIKRFENSAFRYNGTTPLDELHKAERDFVHKQTQLYLDHTYRKAVKALLTLCTSVGTLEVAFKVKIQEIMSYTSPEVDDDVGVAAVVADAAAAVVDVAADVAGAADAALDIVDAAVDIADAAGDIADAAAVIDNMADAAVAAVDMVDVAVVAVDTAAAAAMAADKMGDV